MKKLELTLNQKRFLIVWILFHSFALLVNLADIEGQIYVGDNKTSDYGAKTPNPITPSKDTVSYDSIKKLLLGLKPGQKIELPPVGNQAVFGDAYSDNNRVTIRLFTSSNHPSDFWPFTTYYEEVPPTSFDMHTTYCYFYGIFNSYNFRAYSFYIFIGLAFVYVPKLWKKE